MRKLRKILLDNDTTEERKKEEINRTLGILRYTKNGIKNFLKGTPFKKLKTLKRPFETGMLLWKLNLHIERLNYTKEKQNEIPIGSYCYNRGKCPYQTTKLINTVTVPWCNKLQAGSIPNGITELELKKLEEVYGATKCLDEMTGLVTSGGIQHKDLGLTLLWDECKECGVNDYDPEFNPKTLIFYGKLKDSTQYNTNSFDVYYKTTDTSTILDCYHSLTKQITSNKFLQRIETVTLDFDNKLPEIKKENGKWNIPTRKMIAALKLKLNEIP
jgi:hypothetical protein